MINAWQLVVTKSFGSSSNYDIRYLRDNESEMKNLCILQWKVTFLSDHRPAHVYFYLISVHTGLRRNAGTKSNVQFIVTGELCDSGIRVLNDEKTKVFAYLKEPNQIFLF